MGISIIKRLRKENDRFLSWEHCIKAFKTIEDTDLLSLHLAWYLASWGMLRNKRLLQKDYKIHEKAVIILLDNRYMKETDINDILELKKALLKHYKQYKINPTDTLLSKIILGTLGIVPAFDRYFNQGFYLKTGKRAGFNEATLEFIIQSLNQKDKNLIRDYEKKLKKPIYKDFPMRIIDMYYWERGFNATSKVGKS